MLVHGAWHDARCWELLVPLLENLGHRVHTPDLPGHGVNPADRARTSLKTYSRYLTQLIDNIDNRVVLVGHSMSGMVISQVAEAVPDRLQRLVYLSAYLPANGQSLFDLIAANRGEEAETAIEAAMRMSADKRTCTVAPASIRKLFYNRCPAELDDRIPARFPDQPALPLSGRASLTAEAFGRVLKTYICCLDDQVIPIRHQRRMLTRQSCEEMVQLDADHSPFLSCPETLAAVLHSMTLAEA